MATCRWCRPQVGALICSGHGPCQDLIEAYATGRLGITEIEAANEDLLYCSNCVRAYHQARRDVVARSKHFGQLLSQKECYRLSTSLTQTLRSRSSIDDVILLEKGQEHRVDGAIGLEEALRTPIMEILNYPFLLLHIDVADRLVEALSFLESLKRPFHLDPYTLPSGVYLLLVNPQEQVRRWALQTARLHGKVSCDEYHNYKDLLHAIIDAKSHNMSLNDNMGVFEGLITKLSLHLFSHKDLKNFWLGVCLLLAILDEQALEALLFDQVPPKNIIEDVLSAMEMITEDESLNPFWPTLQCLMVMLDRLGEKLWTDRNLDPMHVFQRVTNSPSYKREVEMALTIRVKHEADFAATCSKNVCSVDATVGRNDLSSPLIPPNSSEKMELELD
uniref:probable helicase senataxin n=1 Tax=Myxine glutinosa TaxID=7769 RepID=UPI00358E026B